MTRIFILAHFANDHEEMLGPYSSIEQAVDQQSSWMRGQRRDIEFSCCLELFKTVHSRWCTFDRTEDFIEEWTKQDERGPRMRVPSQRNPLSIAAE